MTDWNARHAFEVDQSMEARSSLGLAMHVARHTPLGVWGDTEALRRTAAHILAGEIAGLGECVDPVAIMNTVLFDCAFRHARLQDMRQTEFALGALTGRSMPMVTASDTRGTPVDDKDLARAVLRAVRFIFGDQFALVPEGQWMSVVIMEPSSTFTIDMHNVSEQDAHARAAILRDAYGMEQVECAAGVTIPAWF